LKDQLFFNPDLTDSPMEGFLHQGHCERHPGCLAQLIASEMMGSDDEGSATKQMKWPAKATHSQAQICPLFAFLCPSKNL